MRRQDDVVLVGDLDDDAVVVAAAVDSTFSAALTESGTIVPRWALIAQELIA